MTVPLVGLSAGDHETITLVLFTACGVLTTATGGGTVQMEHTKQSEMVESYFLVA